MSYFYIYPLWGLYRDSQTGLPSTLNSQIYIPSIYGIIVHTHIYSLDRGAHLESSHSSWKGPWANLGSHSA